MGRWNNLQCSLTAIIIVHVFEYNELIKGQYNYSSAYGVYSKSTATYDYDTVSVYTVTVRCDDGDDTVDGVLTINLIRNEVKYTWYASGADPGFKVRGGHLKKLRRAEGGAKMFGYFVWKITILGQNIFFNQF